MIKISNLSKSYGKKEVLHGLNFDIPDGVYGLLGENGAGKTTLLRILATLSGFNSGGVTIYEHDLLKDEKIIRKMVGFLPQHFNFYPNLTVLEALNYFAELKAIPKEKRKEEVKRLLEFVNLSAESEKKVKALSGGMRQRLGIAQSIMGDPKLIILDEPTTGLDPVERLSFRNLINEISKDRAVILSTHIVMDVHSSCEHVGVLKSGRIIFNGRVETMIDSISGKIYSVKIELDDLKNFSYAQDILSLKRFKNELNIRFFSEKAPSSYNSITQETPTLEDAYICLVRKEFL